VFISFLARGEMAAIRGAARQAVESLDMRPVMSETEPAVGDDPRRALLNKVGTCDALLLLLGAEYGEPGVRGISPTEEESNRLCKAHSAGPGSAYLSHAASPGAVPKPKVAGSRPVVRLARFATHALAHHNGPG
jgi:hypothetical protein